MRKFKDNAGREWDIHLTVKKVQAIRDQLQVDPLKTFEDGHSEKILDIIMFVNILEVLCDDQKKQRNMSSDDFADAFVGGDFVDRLTDARSAFFEEVLRFFQSDRQTIIRQMLAKRQELEDVTLKKLAIDLEALNVTTLKSATKSQATSAPTRQKKRRVN